MFQQKCCNNLIERIDDDQVTASCLMSGTNQNKDLAQLK